MKIYTKTGDKGETALLGGRKVKKNDIKIDAYGTVDELNSYLGLVNDNISNLTDNNELILIQNILFDIGSNLAMDKEANKRIELKSVEISDIEMLEHSIDKMNLDLKPLKNFILPGGDQIVSFIHIARCVCRRAERIIVALTEVEPVNPEILQYINRLSDYLFVLARYVSHKLNIEEIIWQKRK